MEKEKALSAAKEQAQLAQNIAVEALRDELDEKVAEFTIRLQVVEEERSKLVLELEAANVKLIQERAYHQRTAAELKRLPAGGSSGDAAADRNRCAAVEQEKAQLQRQLDSLQTAHAGCEAAQRASEAHCQGLILQAKAVESAHSKALEELKQAHAAAIKRIAKPRPPTGSRPSSRSGRAEPVSTEAVAASKKQLEDSLAEVLQLRWQLGEERKIAAELRERESKEPAADRDPDFNKKKLFPEFMKLKRENERLLTALNLCQKELKGRPPRAASRASGIAAAAAQLGGGSGYNPSLPPISGSDRSTPR